MLNKKDFEIIEIVKENPSISPGGVFDKVLDVSYATVKRILSKLVVENFLTTTGKGKGTKYSISDSFKLFLSIDIEKYYEKEIVRVKNEENGEIEEAWTGNYIFENEWQSFSTKKDRTIELKSVSRCACLPKPRRRQAKKVGVKLPSRSLILLATIR